MKLAFDIGANIGDVTQKMLERTERVIAFEPNPQLAETLKVRYPERVTVDTRAVSDKEGTALFWQSPTHTISTLSDSWRTQSRFAQTHQWNQKLSVTTVTLDQVIQEYGTPDMIKIDVEGHEKQVLLGLSQLLPKCLISFEWAEEMRDSIERTLIRLESLGYTHIDWTEGDALRFPNEMFQGKSRGQFIQEMAPLRKREWGMCYCWH